ncbi:MAG TPA: DNA polymerase IV [Candidatus Acidoferrales bacterium]
MPKLASFRAKHGPAADVPPAATILHVDMDAFYVSVELLARPELRGKPVVVGGRRDQRGVVSAASYEARKFGVHSAMPLRTAAKLCPHAVFLDGNMALYAQWSDRIAGILAQYSPIVEMISIDEAYLDLAGSERLLGAPLAAAHKLHEEIESATSLPCSIGLASTRLVAKVASEQAKPRGLLWVPPGTEAAFLAPLGVRKIPGIGEVTEKALRGLNIETVGQLAATPLERLEHIFGQWGTALHRKAHGQDAYEFLIDAEPKSISQNRTFGEDTADEETLHSTLSHLCQKAGKRLREAGLHARTITLTIRYAGFHTITRARTLEAATQVDADIIRTTRDLLAQHWERPRKIRLLGVALTQFTHGEGQLPLLDAGRREKLERLARVTDRLRDRFGFDKVQLGGSLPHHDDE